jgi:flagellin
MSNGVVLSAAMRSNLLSLQQTQKSIDATQLRLATGKKVNSALDHPQNFFASKALQNRSSDLNRLLDGIGQNIQVIKAADNGVTALTKLVEQADSVANSARDALAQGTSEAKATSNKDLSKVGDLTSLPGMTTTGAITLSLTNKAGEALDIGTFGAAGAGKIQVTIGLNESIQDIVAKINDLHIQPTNGTSAIGEKAFEAKLNDKGFMEIRSLNGGNFTMGFESVAGTSGTANAAELAFASALGFGEQTKIMGDTATTATNDIGFTAMADVALRSFSLHKNDNGSIVRADRSSLLSDIIQNDGVSNIFGGINAAGDVMQIGINGGTPVDISLSRSGAPTQPGTLQDLIDNINNDGTLKTMVKASFDEDTGQLVLKPISPQVKNVQLGFSGTAAGDYMDLGFAGAPSMVTTVANQPVRANIELGNAASQLAQYESEFNNIREQISQLVSNGDTGYRGTNLLYGDNLLSTFNEHRSSNLVTEGVIFTADGLGMEEADFSRLETVENALSQVSKALNTVRDFGSTLANDLSIIQARQDFTKNMINTLTEGADNLVNADQNEEGARLLALQTRQSLGVTSLSLASESQQAILRLF